MNRLQNKVIIITGAGSGVGQAATTLFTKEGAKVVAADINMKNAEVTAKLVKDAGGEATPFFADVSKTDDVKNLIDKTVQMYGRLDVLYNNAGIAVTGTLLDTSEEMWDRTMNTNLKSVFLTCKFAIPYMLKQGGGTIINTASVNGLVGLPNDAVYDASKGGVVLLTKATALDFGTKNIRVNCICPGTIDTPFTHNALKEYGNYQENLEMLKKMNAALQRLVKPMEVAQLALFLASDESSAITGAAYVVDAGYSAI